MTDEPSRTFQSSQIDPIVLKWLACPACRGELSVNGERLVCAECGRAFPVVDGIPVLIAERAEKINSSE
ncbi:MAG: Trm112 family protein [Terracidiphilus sp.]|jgi:uncharacterized protein YbaR (Trm112 family)